MVRYSLSLHLLAIVIIVCIVAPTVTSMLYGIDVNITTIFLLFFYRLMKWSNTILMLSCVFSCYYVFLIDIKRFNLPVFLLQIGEEKKYLYDSLFSFFAIYAIVFFCLDGFGIPAANLAFKRLSYVVMQKQILQMMRPKDAIAHTNAPDYVMIFSKKSSATRLENVILDKRKASKDDIDFTMLIKDADFFMKKNIDIVFSNGIGQTRIIDNHVMFSFERGHIKVPYWKGELKASEISILELEDTNDILKRFSFSFLSLLIPYWIIATLFAYNVFIFWVLIFIFVVIFLWCINVYNLNMLLLLSLVLIVLYCYRNVKYEQ